MKKIISTTIVFVFAGVCFATYNLCMPSQNTLKKYAKHKKVNTKQSIKYNTYTNERLGITFQYPDTWTKYGEESNAINRKGETMAIHINFTDTISNSFLFIEYHLPPYGAELYEFSKAEFDSIRKYNNDATEITVAGRNAIQVVSIMRNDIKGNVIDPPLKIVSVTFLDKKRTGEFELRFKTPLPIATVEIKKFEKILSTIKFTGL